MRQVVLVCGPPCAGKSTWVAQRIEPDDIVVDFDILARRLGSDRKWCHRRSVADAAERWAQDLMDRVALLSGGRAWVIRTAPEPWRRVELARRLKADRVLVLKPPLSLLVTRALSRPVPRETTKAILRWLDRYGPSPVDELVI